MAIGALPDTEMRTVGWKVEICHIVPSISERQSSLGRVRHLPRSLRYVRQKPGQWDQL